MNPVNAAIDSRSEIQDAVAHLIKKLWDDMSSHDLINIEISSSFIHSLTCSCPEEDFCGQNWQEIVEKVLQDIAQMTNPLKSAETDLTDPVTNPGLFASKCPQQQLYTYLFTKMALEHLKEHDLPAELLSA